ncbi:MAG: helix-turn-helix transcriptional regulator [Fibrobacterales bacterium]|nr:helix-turn-helix transcriptional regulator [Fibrobacterales bacterium]
MRATHLKFLIAASALTVGALAFFLKAGSIPVVELFPAGETARALPWDDRLESEDSLSRGNSTSGVFVLEDRIVWRWRVAPGFEYPYAGFELRLGKGGEGTDLSGCDSLYVGLESRSGGELLAELRTFDPARTTPNDGESRRLLQKRVEFGPGQNALAVALNDFRMPEWWRDERRVPQTSNEQFLDRALAFGFQADERLLGRSDTVQVLWISAAPKNWRSRSGFVLAGMLCAMGAVALLFAEQFARRRQRLALFSGRTSRSGAAREPAREPDGEGASDSGEPAAAEEPAPGPETPAGESEEPEADEDAEPGDPGDGPEEIPAIADEDRDIIEPSLSNFPEEDFERIREWMGAHFTEPEASPETAANDLGWSVSKLGRVVKAGSGKTFSAWLLDLRLQRAAKMLEETALPVAQVAYDNGFAQPSHFNRRFAERYKTTPTEFRRRRLSRNDRC